MAIDWKNITIRAVDKVLRPRNTPPVTEDRGTPAKFGLDALLFDGHQNSNRSQLAQAMKRLLDTGKVVLTQSDVAIILHRQISLNMGSYTVNYRSQDLFNQDELIGSVDLNIGGLNYRPAEALGMVNPEINAAASCTLNFSAIYTRDRGPQTISWLLDVYQGQFKNGLLAQHPPVWDLDFYSKGTHWASEDINKLAKPKPFFTLHNVKVSLKESLGFSFASDSPLTHSATFYSEDPILNLNYIF
jgi:hypothetical protein